MKNLNEQLEEELQEPGFMGILKSQNWALGVFLFLITPLMVHTGSLILKVTGIDFEIFPHADLLYSGLFAIGFDLAILTFAVNGRKREAGVMAFFVFVLNLAFLNYDFLTKLGLESTSELIKEFPVSRIVITLIFSALGAWIVHSYVSFFIEKGDERKKLFGWIKRANTAEEALKKNNDTIDAFKSEIGKLRKSVTVQKSIIHNNHSRSRKIIRELREKKRDNATLKEKINRLQMKLDNLTASEIIKAAHVNGNENGSSNGVSKEVEKDVFSACNMCERTFKSQQQENAVRGRCTRCKEAKEKAEREEIV